MTTIFFILGLIIGSFLNAVVYRLKTVESLWERSHCPVCKKKIRWHDNIPLLSFLLLSAKCRDCGEKISWSYPTMEFGVGVIFALVGNSFFSLENSVSYLPTLFYLIMFSLLVIIFAYDFKYMEIPMLVFWIAVGIAGVYYLMIYSGLVNQSVQNFHPGVFSAVVSGIIAFVFFFALAHFSKETWMGYGDAYVGFLVGFLVGWPEIFVSLMLSFTIGAIFGISLVFFGKKTMKSQVPFAPFLVIGSFLAILLPRIFPQLQFFPFYF